MDERVALSEDENGRISHPPIPPAFMKWFLLGGAAVFLIWAIATSWLSPIIEPDINQHRRNTILPPPQETSQIRQSFTPNHDGLAEVEVKVAREATNETGGRLELQLLDEAGEMVTAVNLETATLVHEQNYVLRFDPQPDSADQTYTLLVSGTANNDVSLWGYDLDVHSGGELTVLGGETAAQDLYLITRYRLTLPIAAQSLWQALTSYGPLLLLALAYILMPGCLVLTLWQSLPTRKRFLIRDSLTWWGVALALGLCLWPFLWEWLSLIGLRWSPVLLWVILIAGWLATAALAFKFRPAPNQPINQQEARGKRQGVRGKRQEAREQPNRPINQSTNQPINQSTPHSQFTIHYSKFIISSPNYLFLLLLLALSTRFLAVRDLTFAPWVDAVRHGLITAVMADSGQVITDYQPWLAVDRFPYHYGFHTISAGLAQMADTPFGGRPLPELLLALGQLLNGLVPLAVYTAAYLFTRRRWAGWTAAFLVALPFFFPAYYATWGRMTQLTGVLVLPVLLALTWQLGRGARRWRASWWLVGLLAGGLFLIHFRVFLLYLVFAGVVWLFSMGRNGRRLISAGLLALVLVAPRIAQLLADTNPARAVSNNLPGYNDFPTGYVTVGWERPLLWMGGAAIVLAVIAAGWRRRWAYGPLFLVVWAGLTAVLLSGSRLGLPETSLINVNSAYIVLFVPLALLLGVVGERLWRWIMKQHWLIGHAGALIVGAGLAAAAVFGMRQQITILNAETILAWPPDEAGLAWLDENVSSETKFAVNSFLWLGSTWAGQDGGAWVVPLTGRESTTPPADYIYDPTLAVAVDEFNNIAKIWGNWADPLVAEQLREEGVTHIFIGARGGFIDPAALAQNPEMEMLFGRDGVFVFALVE